jgi:hypothetical protein
MIVSSTNIMLSSNFSHLLFLVGESFFFALRILLKSRRSCSLEQDDGFGGKFYLIYRGDRNSHRVLDLKPAHSYRFRVTGERHFLQHWERLVLSLLCLQHSIVLVEGLCIVFYIQPPATTTTIANVPQLPSPASTTPVRPRQEHHERY